MTPKTTRTTSTMGALRPRPALRLAPGELCDAARALFGWAHCHAHEAGEAEALVHLLSFPGGPTLHTVSVRLERSGLSPHELRQAALGLYDWAACHASAPASPQCAAGEPHALRHVRYMCPGGAALHDAAARLLGEGR